MPSNIPVSVIITTLNEAANLPRCLSALGQFDEIIVADSHSSDGTADVARSFGARVELFSWNGAYPKKRQWCLDRLTLTHDRVFFVDGDEEITPQLRDEIAALDWRCAGYFVRGNYVADGKELRFGMSNSKLCLFDRRLIAFPVIDDLDAPGMGEIEGHYQPVAISRHDRVGRLRHALRHHAIEDLNRYRARHGDYADWHRIASNRLPSDPRQGMRALKRIYRLLPCKRLFFLIYYYFIKLGVLEYPRNVEIFRQKCRYLGYDSGARS